MSDLGSLWQKFLHTSHAHHHKQTRCSNLDTFLNSILRLVAQGEDIPVFSDMKSVSNILAREFLVEVHRICNESDDDDVAELQEYLLRGRGNLILRVLGTIGVKGLSCSKELGELLVSILPICFRFPVKDDQVTSMKDVELLGIDACFSQLRDGGSSQYTSPKFPLLSQVDSTKTITSSFHINQYKEPQSVYKPWLRDEYAHDASSSSDSDSESGMGNRGTRDTIIQGNPNLLEGNLHNIGVVRGVVQLSDDNDSEKSDNETTTPDAETSPLKREINAIELTILVLTLVKDLCHDDCVLWEQTKAVSSSVLPSLSQLSMSLHEEIQYSENGDFATNSGDDGAKPDSWSSQAYMLVQRYLIRVIFTLMVYINVQNNGVNQILNSDVLPNLLEVSCDCMSIFQQECQKNLAENGNEFESEKITTISGDESQPKEDCDSDEKSPAKTEQNTNASAHTCDEMLVLATEIIQGTWTLIQVIFKTINLTPSVLNQSLQVFSTLTKYKGLELFKSSLLLWESKLESCDQNCAESSKIKRTINDLLNTHSGVVIAMKTAKINYIHSVKCSKKVHKKCDYSLYKHHHHDILGMCIQFKSKQDLTGSLSYGSLEALNDNDNESKCAVAILNTFLMELLNKARTAHMIVKSLQCLGEEGVCCCVPPGIVMKHMLEKLPSQSVGIRNFNLTVLGRVLIDQCGGSKQIQSDNFVMCHVCRDEHDEHSGTSTDHGHDAHSDNEIIANLDSKLPKICEASDSAISSSETSLHEEQTWRSSKWRCLKLLHPMILGDDESLGVQVMQHTLKLVSQGSQSMLRDLFFYNFVPILQATKHKFLQKDGGRLADENSKTGSKYQNVNTDSSGKEVVRVADKVIQYCLTALPILLQSEPVHNLFLNYSGVTQLCQLVQIDKLRHCVLNVFQVLVILEEKKRVGNFTNKHNISEEYIALQSEDEENNEQYLPNEDDKRSTKPVSILEAFLKMLFSGRTDVWNLPKTSGNSQDATDNVDSEDEDSMLSPKLDMSGCTPRVYFEDPADLPIICDLWCAAQILFDQSKKFRQTFLKNNGAGLSYDLLCKSLDCLSRTSESCSTVTAFYSRDRSSDFACWIALLQATLNVSLACAAARIPVTTEEITIESLMETVTTCLQSSPVFTNGQSSGLKTICDMLLNCATRASTETDLIQSHTFAFMHLKLDDATIIEKELQELSDSSSALDTETCVTEQGYEADSEYVSDDSIRDRRKRGSDKPKIFKALHSTILYPGVCTEVLNIIILYYNTLKDATVAAHGLLKLIALAKQSPNNASILYTKGMVEMLLTGFKEALSSKDEQYTVIRGLALDLFLAISRHSFSSKELHLFLTFLAQDENPCEDLLSALLDLSHSFTLQPSYILCCPLVRTDLATDLEISVRSVSSDMLTASIRPMSRSPNDPNDFSTLLKSTNAHEVITIENSSSLDSITFPGATTHSPALCSPLQIQLKDKTMWPTNQRGFSISLWVRVGTNHSVDNKSGRSQKRRVPMARENSLKKESSWMLRKDKERRLPPRLRAAMKRDAKPKHWNNQCLHIAAIGNQDLMFEVWTDPTSANIVFRIVSHYQQVESVLCEASFSSMFEHDKWHHLTVSYAERSNANRILANISAVVDGCYCKETNLEYIFNHVGFQATSNSCLFMGHALSTEDLLSCSGTLLLGNMMLFRDVVLTKHQSFHLYSLGPDCCTLSQCDCSEQTADYSHFITEELVNNSGLSSEVFTGNHTIYLQHLRNYMEKLVLSYSPKNAPVFNLYNNSSAFKASTSGLGNVLINAQKGVAFNPLTQQPTSVPAKLNTDIAPQIHRGLTQAVDEIGGIGVFLFLFAKVIENEETRHLQAQSLKLLFVLINSNPINASNFIQMSGYEMLAKVMVTSRCIVGFEILKVLLDACMTSSMIRYNRISGEYELNADTTALIYNTPIVTKLLLVWQIWERAEAGVWELAFKAFTLLVDKRHPNAKFNIAQLQNVGLVEKILTICLERLQESYHSLSQPICNCILALLRQLIGQPADTHNVITICDFLLLTHPAASTFVYHTHGSYYFTHKWASNTAKLIYSRSTSTLAASTPMKRIEESDSENDIEVDNVFYQHKDEEMVSPARGKLARSHSLPPRASTPVLKEKRRYHSHPQTPRTSTPQPVSLQELLAEYLPPIELYDSQLPIGIVPNLECATRFDLDSVNPVGNANLRNEGVARNLNFAESLDDNISDRRYYHSDSNTGSRARLSSDGNGNELSTDTYREHFYADDSSDYSDTEMGNKEKPANFSANYSEFSVISSAQRENSYERSASRSEYSEEWEVVGEQDQIEIGEEGLVDICAGLLDMLSEILVIQPEADLKQLLGVVLKPEVLLVLAHHSAPDIRANAVKLLDVYLHRCSKEQTDAFLKINGFHLLANQLHQHSVTKDVVEACFTILCGKPVDLGDEIDINLLQDVTQVQQQAVVPLLALMEGSVKDTALCHNILFLLMQIFQGVTSLATTMLDHGLVETLCNVVHVLVACPPRPTDLGSDEKALLVMDVEQFLCMIAEKTFSMPGVVFYQHLEDCVTLLQLLEHKQVEIYGANSVEASQVRQMQCHTLQGVLDYITDKLESPSGFQLRTRTFTNAAGLLGGGKKESLSQAELLDRVKKVIVMAVDFVCFTNTIHRPKSVSEERLHELVENTIEVVPSELHFARTLLEFIVKGIVVTMERSFFQRKSLNSTIMWQAKDLLKIQCSRLLTHMLSSTQDVGQRLYCIDLLANETRCKDILKLIIGVQPTGAKLTYYIWNLLTENLDKMTRIHRDEVDEVLNSLQALGLQPLRIGSRVTYDQRQALEEDRRLWFVDHKRERTQWLKKREAVKQRLLHKLDPLSKKTSNHAMEVTQTVTYAQNGERKKFLEHIKRSLSNGLATKKSWQQLIQQLTHEKAVWHCPKSYPMSWQLDPTEGPCRVRRRLQRCHLNIKPRFLSDDNKDKLNSEKYDPPLSYLFDEENLDSDSKALIYKLHTSENIQYTCTRCSSVTPSSETSGSLLVGQTDVYFVADEAIMDVNYTQVLLGNKDLLFMTLPHEYIKEIHKRRYQLQDHGLEIFLTNGKTYLLAFTSTKERDNLYRHLLTLELPQLVQYENLNAIQQMWLDGKMTNFEYLTQLNKMSGRSFNDLMQYPVLPFILSDYESEVLDLLNPGVYRNLSKPISVQNKDSENKYLENYKWLEIEKKRYENVPEIATTEYRAEPYHYGSHYSNSGTVLHFLVRLPPFTQMFLGYQDDNFDLPDRTFHAMATTWWLASFQSTTDVKELIPEFFFLPEFLCNNEGFHFGKRQDGINVWDIHLPTWCKKDPRLFTLIHRQALESDYVTAYICNWIDLVFGYKQQGKAAVQAINVFHPATYFGVDVDAITDPVRRTAVKTMIKTYGQTPKQLFTSPHPQPQRTTSKRKTKFNPLKTVKGLRWGHYIGSPDCTDPVVTWSQAHGSVVASLVALPTGDVFGLGPGSCLLVMYSKERGITSMNSVQVQWASILSWDHPDNIIRVKNKRDQPAVNFLHWPTTERVTCCASVSDCRLLFVAGTSGVITVLNTKFNMSKQSHLQVFGKNVCLYGHSAPITAMVVCKSYSILLSASHDCTLIIWDLNRLTYVRSITDHKSPIQALCVSETSGDIASVSHTERGSQLLLHTVNAQHVAAQECEELILCLAYSSAQEGCSVNMIVGGLSNGHLRMWSSWDLTPVRDVHWKKFNKPIVSLTFTHDDQRLFASSTDGTVAKWEKTGSTPKDIAFIPFL